MARMTRKQLLKQDEFVDSAVDFGQWLEENWRMLVNWLVLGAVVAVVITSVVGIMRSRASAANELLSQAMARYDVAQGGGFADTTALEEALASFDEASGKGSASTKQVASYYRGATLYRLGRLDEAVKQLEAAVSKMDSGSTLHGGAEALLATALYENGQSDRAVEILERMVDAEGSTFPPAEALMQLARIRNAEGNSTAARATWQRVIDEYPASQAAGEARSLLGT